MAGDVTKTMAFASPSTPAIAECMRPVPQSVRMML
ncbi:Uncharacterised protein [Mycobacteroides abscessus subsp. abscessus]|nr:Uncharacterised protein [Mycobacteroides abscessus subsp. abscessus]